MALKMIHVVAARLDDGMEVMFSDNHINRDADYQYLLDCWAEMDSDEPAPVRRGDFFVPFEATDQEIMQYLRHHVMQSMMHEQLKRALSDGVLVMLAIKPPSDDAGPEPTLH